MEKTETTLTDSIFTGRIKGFRDIQQAAKELEARISAASSMDELRAIIEAAAQNCDEAHEAFTGSDDYRELLAVLNGFPEASQCRTIKKGDDSECYTIKKGDESQCRTVKKEGFEEMEAVISMDYLTTKKLLTKKEAAIYIGISLTTLNEIITRTN